MKVTYLESDVPITKKYFNAKERGIQVTQYPNISTFSSYTIDHQTIENLLSGLRKIAQQGGCILKGEIQREIVKESRAGTTDPKSSTEWLCLDIDGATKYAGVDQVLFELGIKDVDHIVQWSSSMSLPGYDGLRCHVFVLLDRPVSAPILKTWLKHKNLTIPNLAADIKLTKTNNALRWPLDITTCQNDKLIYVAPPTLSGIEDPFPGDQRITLEKRAHRTFTIEDDLPSSVAVRLVEERTLNDRRAAVGLRAKKPSMVSGGATEYQKNPDTCEVTGIRQGRGFTYFNLNGGDSWGYYHPEGNPEYIYNFKGEPAYRTQDLIPEYWNSLSHEAKTVGRHAGASSSPRETIFYISKNTANYQVAELDYTNQKVQIFPAKSKEQLVDIMAQHGVSLKKGFIVPTYEVTYDPLNPVLFDKAAGTLNIYSKPDLNPDATVLWPNIQKLIFHVLGADTSAYDHFINWAACIYQLKTSTNTAWILQGTYGTGKGMLYHQVLSPLLGPSNVVSKRMEEIEEIFTGYMENKQLVFVDEMHKVESVYHSKIESKLKNLITEPKISVRTMYSEAREVKNYTNMIFASNERQPINVRPGDRRFNVGGFQPDPLDTVMTEAEKDVITSGAELPGFAYFLSQLPADKARARTPLLSAARATLIRLGKSSLDITAEAVLQGDLEFFWSQLLSEAPSNPLQVHKYERYKELLKQLVQNQPGAVSREELRILFEWTCDNIPASPNKLTNMLKHRGLDLGQTKVHGKNVTGMKTRWSGDPQWHAKALQDIAAGIV